jgi:hypothetical protein
MMFDEEPTGDSVFHTPGLLQFIGSNVSHCPIETCYKLRPVNKLSIQRICDSELEDRLVRLPQNDDIFSLAVNTLNLASIQRMETPEHRSVSMPG